MASMDTNLTHTTYESFPDDVVRSDLPVLVDFYADWCSPCSMLGPILERLAGEYAGKVKFVKVNVDEEPGLAETHGISGIPTLLIFRGGEPVERLVGFLPARAIKEKLDQVTVA